MEIQETKRIPVLVASPSEASCLRKLKPGEPSFTLRAQDLTADITVLFWVRMNAEIKSHLDVGVPLASLIAYAKQRAAEAFPWPPSVTDVKLLEALDVSMAMGEWPDRKVAD